jgi:hypothetical protein
MQKQTRREMLNLKLKMIGLAGCRNNQGRVTGARRWVVSTGAGVLAAGLLIVGAAQGQTSTSSSTTDQTPTAPRPLGKIALAALPSYDNRYEIFGGLNFMNFQAGQALPNRMNLGGGELLGTYWLNKKLGVAADYRIDAGTTPVFANGGTTPESFYGTGVNNRPLVYLNTFMLGGQYRGPKNQYVAIDYHALFGVSDGTFNYSLKNVIPIYYSNIGLYTNRTKPIAALGGSIDFNRSKNFAVRLSPDLILEHFGTETREFFGISGGVIYRFGKVK